MSIGTTLAQARRDAGLTVTEVSQKTRIRETIIRGIERDDYSACGGDFYARGHIRAMARVVRTDPVPLIEQYDSSIKAPDEITAAEAFRPALGLSDREAAAERAQARERRLAAERRPSEGTQPSAKTETLSDAPDGTPQAGGMLAPGDPDTLQDAQTPPDGLVPLGTLFSDDTPPGPLPPGSMPSPVAAPTARDTLAEDMRPVPETTTAGEATPVTDPLSIQAPLAGMSESESVRQHRRPQLNWTALLGVAVLAAVALLGYFLAAGPGHPVASPSPQSHHQAAQSKPRPSPTAARSTPATQPAAQALNPVTAEAFGPSGAGQGDNPQLAQGVVTGGTWHTSWYASAAFGNLQQGTGLLLDMGKTVTITKAQLTLANPTGADLQLRVGDTPTLAALPPVAGATNAGGVLQLSPTKPATGRYVLIWFTNLPPDTSGTFQASVSGVQLQGQA